MLGPYDIHILYHLAIWRQSTTINDLHVTGLVHRYIMYLILFLEQGEKSCL